MAYDLVKIGLTLVVLALVVAVMALFVSGFLSVYKPGGAGVKTPASIATGGKNIGAVVPSPSARANVTRPSYARYMPPGPMIPEPAQPAFMPMPMGEGLQLPSESPAVPPLKPSYGTPAVPNIPSAPGISGIIDVLFRLLPLVFHHRFDMTPIWPSFSR